MPEFKMSLRGIHQPPDAPRIHPPSALAKVAEAPLHPPHTPVVKQTTRIGAEARTGGSGTCGCSKASDPTLQGACSHPTAEAPAPAGPVVIALWRVPGLAVPANAVGSGWLNQMGGVGPRGIPIKIGQPIREAVANGNVLCWITGQPIEALDLDHVIPWCYGGASNIANLLPANASANRSRGKSLDLLHERKIGWKWDLDSEGRRVRVPDRSQRLVRVLAEDGEVVYWSVPKFCPGEVAVGAATAAGLAVAIEGVTQWRSGEFRPADMTEEAAKAAAAYTARYSGKIAVKALAPRAFSLVGPTGVQVLSKLSGPVGALAAIYGAEAITQGVALKRGQVTLRKAGRDFVLAPVGAVKDAAALAVHVHNIASPRQRAIRRNQEKWQSVSFIRDLNRPDEGEVYELAS
mgnify:FL=1